MNKLWKIENGKWNVSTFFLFAVLAVFAQNGNATQLGGQAGSFLRVGIGADRLGMGDVGTALSGAGMSWYYNPASVPFQETRQTSLGFRSMSLDRSMLYAGYSMPLQGNAGLAFGVMRAATSNIDLRDSNGSKFDEITYSDNLIHGTFSLRPHENFAMGITVKWMIASAPQLLTGDKTLYAYGMGIDLGAQGRYDKFRFGVQIRDINAKVGWDASDVWGDGRGAVDDNLPLMYRIGVSYDPRFDLTVATDILINPTEAGKSSDGFTPHVGVEWRATPAEDRFVAVRGGFDGANPTFGLGLGMKLRYSIVARMDYAYIFDIFSPSGSHLIGWTFGF